MSDSPFGTEGNGRDKHGRFTPGNTAGKGNPTLQKVAMFRCRLLEKTSPADFDAVWRTLVKAAKAGEAWAVKELLDRLLGKAPQALELSNPDGTMGAQAVIAAVLEALADQPDVRAKVAARLMEMTRGPAGTNGDRP